MAAAGVQYAPAMTAGRRLRAIGVAIRAQRRPRQATQPLARLGSASAARAAADAAVDIRKVARAGTRAMQMGTGPREV